MEDLFSTKRTFTKSFIGDICGEKALKEGIEIVIGTRGMSEFCGILFGKESVTDLIEFVTINWLMVGLA